MENITHLTLKEYAFAYTENRAWNIAKEKGVDILLIDDVHRILKMEANGCQSRFMEFILENSCNEVRHFLTETTGDIDPRINHVLDGYYRDLPKIEKLRLTTEEFVVFENESFQQKTLKDFALEFAQAQIVKTIAKIADNNEVLSLNVRLAMFNNEFKSTQFYNFVYANSCEAVKKFLSDETASQMIEKFYDKMMMTPTIAFMIEREIARHNGFEDTEKYYIFSGNLYKA